jgi:hypothetical protein
MDDQPNHMWGYWRGKKGLKTALRDYYPNKLKTDPRLSLAMTQIETAEAAIEAIMNEEGDDDDESYG